MIDGDEEGDLPDFPDFSYIEDPEERLAAIRQHSDWLAERQSASLRQAFHDADDAIANRQREREALDRDFADFYERRNASRRAEGIS